jgi:endonuclease YncB( thermonuclease family)
MKLEVTMAQFKVIKGTFHVKGYQPDGDSIRFRADNFDHWSFFPNADKDKKRQLRIEAIDALETHYEGYHQPMPFAIGALEKLLALIDIKNVKYSLSVTNIVDADDETPGFIASATMDRFSRPISFIFPNIPDLTDGAVLEAENLPLEKSVNYLLLREGLVYPTFYTTTDPIVLEKFRQATERARIAGRGIWAIDRTSDFTIWDTRTIQYDILILPKLFRRLVGFFDRYQDFKELHDYMVKQQDDLQLVNNPQPRSLASLMTIKGRRLKLKVPVEDILFSPK